jgi:hypothetical protein
MKLKRGTYPMVTENKAMKPMIILSALLCLLPLSQSHAAENLSPLAWGTKNTGAAQQLSIDHYTTGNILGVAGEDIHLAPPMANSRKVLVGVLDTGIDFNHPQLKNIIASPGYNAIMPALDASDAHGHGTHVAGIIAAELDATGFHGVSSNVKILPVKVIQTGPNAPIRPQDIEAGAGTALTETVAAGLVWAINNGAEVINLSMAWPISIHSQKVDDAMALAAQKNVIIVSSAGNDGTTANVYPCVYDNVVCVGAHGPDGTLAYFSNYGSMVDVSAPGISILSTWPLNKTPTTFAGQVGYEFRNGTSMSAPFVSGALAELLSRGYSPEEAKARLMLGTRKTSQITQFSTDIQGQYSANISTEVKNTRFGNIDLTKAMSLTPSPLILPKKKGVYEIEWDGVAEQVTIPMSWINRWVDAGAVDMTVNGQDFHFAAMPEGSEVITPVILNLGSNPEHTFHLTASVTTPGFQKSGLEVTVQLVHTFTSASIPSSAIVKNIHGLNTHSYSDIRSVVNVGKTPHNDLLFTRMVTLPPTPTPVPTATPVPSAGTIPAVSPTLVVAPTRAQLAAAAATAAAARQAIELAIVQDDTLLASATLNGLTQSQFLNMYRLPDNTYVAIFTKVDPTVSRPNVLIEKFDTQLKFISETVVGTDVTVLPESFVWAPYKTGFTPLWVALGFTPAVDAPAYDPWNPTYRDMKMPRIFYLDESGLRIVPLAADELPLQMLPDGRVMISKGSTYFQQYNLLTLKDGKIVSTQPLTLPEYRMFIGLGAGIPTLDLKGADASMIAISGASSPGNLRVTGVGANQPFDATLQRSSVLDALVTVTGSYQDSMNQYYFAQTHFDLQFFKAGSNQTLSSSLNRYSYIPSMIYGRTIFPTIVRDQNGNALPAVYVEGSVANAMTSEVYVADIANHKLIRPASLRLRVKDHSCYEMGNLIQARIGESAKQVFICGNNVVQIPLVVSTR